MGSVDFSDFDEFEQTSKKWLQEIFQNRKLLSNLLLQVPQNDHLFSLATRYDALDKVVIWKSDCEKRFLQLHIYKDPITKMNSENLIDIEAPHTHRFNFTTYILSGGYRHIIYHHDPLLRRLTPTLIRQENPGDSYTLHHSQFHAISRKPNTVTLFLRGPYEKSSFQVFSKAVGKTGDVKGLSPKEKRKKALSHEEFSFTLQYLSDLQII